MSRKRKEKSIPLAHPPASVEEVEDIPEDEQWRIIEKSGVLNIPRKESASLKSKPAEHKSSPGYEEGDFSDEVFNSILFIIPFSFVYLMMDILAHQQYGQHPTIAEALGRLARSLPFLSFFTFFSLRHKTHRLLQTVLFLISTLGGTRMIWVVNREPWGTVIRECPPLGTIWIYAVVHLNLLPTVISLGLVAWAVKLLELKIIF